MTDVVRGTRSSCLTTKVWFDVPTPNPAMSIFPSVYAIFNFEIRKLNWCHHIKNYYF